MNTAEVAEALGTTPRTLRQFLRSPASTFVAVGSGARYDFTKADLPTLKKKFAEWNGSGKPKAKTTRPKTPKPRVSAEDKRAAKDQEVWAEEVEKNDGKPIVLEDMRDPRVRARVRSEAKAAEERLMLLLLSKGLHVTQLGDR